MMNGLRTITKYNILYRNSLPFTLDDVTIITIIQNTSNILSK